MTQAVITLLIFFAIIFALYVFAIIFLWLQKSKEKSVKAIHADAVLIVYATQSGQAEAIATQTAERLAQSGQAVELMSIESFNAEQLKTAHQVIWVVSTYGEGDAPDIAQHFDHYLAQHSLDLSHQSYAILALGDRRYANFCEFGHRLNQFLQQSQAKAWFDLVTVDQMSADDLSHWNIQLSQHFQHDMALQKPTRVWNKIQLKSRCLLNAGSQGQPLYHLVFDVPKEMLWQSGDIVEIQCENNHAVLADFQSVHPELNDLHIEQLRDRNLRQIPTRTHQQSIAEWLEDFKPLPIREYSIASRCNDQQLELVVRQEQHGDELGLGSGLLTHDLKLGQCIHAYIRANPNFHVAEGVQAAILIGNGSGMAGLLSHLKQRVATEHYQNWLIYGERQQAFDAIFADELHELQSQGKIVEIDRVFSREGFAEKYVQDVLVVKKAALIDWLEQGACLYICGSLNMAKEVDATLQEILGIEQLHTLRKAGRYRRDVY